MGWSDAYDPTTLRLTSKASPEAGTVSYTYNTDGTVATVTDAKSQQKKFTYDSSGRVTKISPSGQNISYPYGSTLDGTNTLGRVNSISYSAGSHSVQEGYTYTSNGDVAEKGIGLDGNNPLNQGALIVTYSYNNDGTLYSVAYPEANTSILGSPAATYTYGRDSMYRLNTLTDQNNNTLVSGVTYSPANQILSLATSTFTETSTYNANLQLATLVSGSYSYQYNYVTGQNNGRVSSIKDNGSGETITYQYDSLNRLIQASGVNDPHGAWSQEFTFDGFGNLTQKIGNNAPNNLTINVNPATNQLTGNGAVYDANGNLTQYTNTLSNMTFSYDSLNRLATASGFNGGGGTATYGYDGSNQRVYSKITNGGVTTETFFFYGADGKKLGVWTIPSLSSKFTLVSLNTWFGGRLLKPQDRLNSLGKYFPYGEDRYSPSPANPANGQEKFATYTRDAETGLDYAYQRYYTAGLGRFMTPDPSSAGVAASTPQTWNPYTYVAGDPINANDSTGLCTVIFAGIMQGPAATNPISDLAASLGADSEYSYQGQSFPASLASVVGESLPGGSLAGQVALNALQYALASNSGSIDIVAYSGGAGAYTWAYDQLTAVQQSRIGNVLYVSPGSAGELADTVGTTSVVEGSGPLDIAAMVGTTIPQGVPVDPTSCGHRDTACLLQSQGASDVLARLREKGPCNSPSIFTRRHPGARPGFGFTFPGRPPDGSAFDWFFSTPAVYGENGEGISWEV